MRLSQVDADRQLIIDNVNNENRTVFDFPTVSICCDNCIRQGMKFKSK